MATPLRRRLAEALRRAVLPVTGLCALAWFLVRVVPRPSRAAYPCQRAAFPLASGFVLWLVSLAASLVGLRQARALFERGRLTLAGVVLAAAVTAGGHAVWQGTRAADAAPAAERFRASEGANVPMGTPVGIHPGRVAWIHDAAATRWDGTTGRWWEDSNTDPERVAAMLSQGVQGLTGEATDAAAWDALFRHFNSTHDRGDRGYRAWERIAVKLNNNQAGNATTRGNESFNAPQLVAELVRQLVEVAGVAPGDITLIDATRYAPVPVRDAVQAVAPGVRFVSYAAAAGNDAHVRDPDSQIRWSQPLVLEEKGGNPTYLPTVVTEASYLINLAGLKAHNLAGVSLTAKNHFGTISASYASGAATMNSPHAAGLHAYASVHTFGGGSGGGDGHACEGTQGLRGVAFRGVLVRGAGHAAPGRDLDACPGWGPRLEAGSRRHYPRPIRLPGLRRRAQAPEGLREPFRCQRLPVAGDALCGCGADGMRRLRQRGPARCVGADQGGAAVA
jgi:hypothetical protein